MKILVSLLMLLIAIPSWARQFDVEVIIFKRSVNAEKTEESWPDSLPEISYQNSGTLHSTGYLNTKGATLLPRSAYYLNSQEQRLRNHAGFEVLLHTAWRQGDNGPGSAPVFHLLGGKDFSSRFDRNGKPITADSPISSIPVMELEGKLQIYVQHYLFANAEFDLREPITRKTTFEDLIPESNSQSNEPTTQVGNLQAIQKAATTEQFLKTYRLDQKRKMKSGEVHYFDHPLMGMIIQVRKAG